jgi:hypothetical protein
MVYKGIAALGASAFWRKALRTVILPDGGYKKYGLGKGLA